jgi:anti-sigma factor RsiW
MSCREFVELVTDYLEGALSWRERRRFEKHLRLCDGCAAYVEQIRTTVVAVGSLREEDIPSDKREELLAAFRDWKRP